MARIREVPTTFSPSERQFLNEVRDTIHSMLPSKNPPQTPQGFTVTPLPGGNRLEWQLTDADSYDVLVSANGAWTAVTGWIIDAGRSNTYTDSIGAAGVTRYYQVRGRIGSNTVGIPTGAVAGTTLALGSGAQITKPVPPNVTAVDGAAGGQIVPVRQRGGQHERQ